MAALAFGFIAALAFHGSRPEPGLARFEARGVLADWPLLRIAGVAIASGDRRRAFRRDSAGGWRVDPGGERAPPDVAGQIETGLKLLRNSAPQRRDLPGSQAVEYGLAPARLNVVVHAADGPSRAIAFGGVNPLGLDRYARIDDAGDIMLLPSFVADPWEKLAAMP